MEDMRNIVVLKDLPSNLVEEAIIVLKQNQKIKKPEYVENKGKTEQKSEKHKFGNYITKEAEMLITDYITKVEKNKKIKNLKIFGGYLYGIRKNQCETTGNFRIYQTGNFKQRLSACSS